MLKMGKQSGSRRRRRGLAILLAVTVTNFSSLSGAGPLLYSPPELVLQLSASAPIGHWASADFNGDGLPDLAVARYVFQSSQVFPLTIPLNNGAGGFVDGTAAIFVGAPPVVQHPRKIVIADFNGDGRPDIFIADHGNDQPPFPGFQN